MAKAVINISYEEAVRLYEDLRKLSETAPDNDTIGVGGVMTNFQLSPADLSEGLKRTDIYVVDEDDRDQDFLECSERGVLSARFCSLSSTFRSMKKANPLFLRELYARLVRADAQDGKIDHNIDRQNWKLSPLTLISELKDLYKKYFTGPIPKDSDLYKLLDVVVSKNLVPIFPCDVYFAGPKWNPEVSLKVFMDHFSSDVSELKEFAESRSFIESTKYYAAIVEGKFRHDVRRPSDYSIDGELNVGEELAVFDLAKRFREKGQDSFAELVCNRMSGKNINAFGKRSCDPDNAGRNSNKKSDDLIAMIDNRGKSPDNREWAEVVPGRPYVFINLHRKLRRNQITDPLPVGWKTRGQHLNDICEYFRGVPMNPGNVQFLGEEQSEVSMPEIKKFSRLLIGHSIYRYFYYQPGKVFPAPNCAFFARRPDFENKDHFFVRLFHEILHSYSSQNPSKGSYEYYAMAATEKKIDLLSQVADFPRPELDDELLFTSAFMNYLGQAIEYQKDEAAYSAVFQGENLTRNEFAPTPAMLLAPKYREYLMGQTQKTIRTPEMKVGSSEEKDNRITYSSPQ